MGEVYLAQHPRLPRKDALKVLGADVSASEEYRDRFGREAELASTLYHSHIVGVHDRGEHDDQLWISMDYVDGRDAAHLLAERFPHGMPPNQVTKIVTAVASALDYAHSRGLLHRDIKPANVMLTDDMQRILLTDFGIARSINDTSSLTATGFTVGTVAYAAPEQLMGQDLDGRTDQYALAATAYHLLTGAQPFPHSNPAVVIGRHLNSIPPAVADTHPELAMLDPVLAKALSKEPNGRYTNCTEFAIALASALIQSAGSPAAATSIPTAATARKASKTPDATRRDSSQQQSPKATHGIGGFLRGLAVLTVCLLTAAVLVLMWPSKQDQNRIGNASPSAVLPPTFSAMRGFVEGYYADLPAQPDAAWAKLDDHCKAQTGYAQFTDFWATIESVTVISISPRDATSVVARLKYVRRDGTSDTEDRWLKMSSVGGTILLNESGIVEAVGDSTPAPSRGGPADETPTSSPTGTITIVPTPANGPTIDQLLADSPEAQERPIVSGLRNQGYGYLDYGLVSQAWDRTCWSFGGAHGASHIAVNDAKNDLIGMQFTPPEADAIIGIALKVHAQPGIETCP
ncbi:MAG: serine/threonine protein kinase [Mycobacterium sp.]|nr:MAG: serine/threonine protein kinase [Mycobacterium sp.]